MRYVYQAIVMIVILSVLFFICGWLAHSVYYSRSAIRQLDNVLTKKAEQVKQDIKESEEVFKSIEKVNTDYAETVNTFKAIKKDNENSVLDMPLPNNVMQLLHKATGNNTNDHPTCGNDDENTKHQTVRGQ